VPLSQVQEDFKEKDQVLRTDLVAIQALQTKVLMHRRTRIRVLLLHRRKETRVPLSQVQEDLKEKDQPLRNDLVAIQAIQTKVLMHRRTRIRVLLLHRRKETRVPLPQVQEDLKEKD
jgi:hypothetical protein